MNASRTPTLLSAAYAHWQSFLPALLFPIVFLYGSVLAEHLGQMQFLFWLVAAPLFFWSSHRASKPWIAKQITYWQAVFWSMLVPFSIWIVAVFSRLAYLG